MRKTLFQFALRISFLVIIFSIGFIALNRFPNAQAELAISQYRELIGNLGKNRDLQTALSDMGLNDLKTRDRASVEAYYQGAKFGQSESAKKVEISKKKISYGFELPGRNIVYSTLREAIAEDDLYISDSAKIYGEISTLTDYYEDSSLALYNVFYYDPKIEIKSYEDSRNNEILLQSFGAARDGLQKTTDRIEKLPNFNDPSIKSFLPEIKDLAKEAGEVSDNAVNNTDKSYLSAKDFSAKIYSLQDRLLADRKKFWGENEMRKKFISDLRLLENRAVELLNKLDTLSYRLSSL